MYFSTALNALVSIPSHQFPVLKKKLKYHTILTFSFSAELVVQVHTAEERNRYSDIVLNL